MEQNEQIQAPQWCENVVIVDGDYIDKVAFDLTVNFERIIGRRIPKADMARWIDCVALDGGIREGNNKVSVVFIHDKSHAQLENFAPGNYLDDLHLKAFSDHLGEFMLSQFPVEREIVEKKDFFLDVTRTICNLREVHRVMIIPDADALFNDLRAALKDVDDEKRITLFTMQPMAGGNFRQEILGYSLMSALGIRGDELPVE